MNNLNELHKYILIKRDVRDLRQIIFGDDAHIHDWDRVFNCIFYIFNVSACIFTL